MKIAIQILNYRNTLFTINCLKAIIKNKYSDCHIYILDNEYSSKTYIELNEFIINNKLIDSISLFRSKRNLGFSGGHNFLNKKILKNKTKKYDFYLILNSDALVSKYFFSKINSYLMTNSRDNHYVYGFPIHSIETKKFLYSVGKINLFTGSVSHSNYEKISGKKYYKYFPSGSALLISDIFIKKEGMMFDDAYFFYFDELDICKRLESYNKEFKIINDVPIYHDHGKSTNLQSNPELFRILNYNRSKFIYYYKYYKFYLPFIKFLTLIKYLISLPKFGIKILLVIIKLVFTSWKKQTNYK